MWSVIVRQRKSLREWLALDVLRRLGRYGAVSIVTSLVVLGTLGVLVGVVDAPAGWSNVIATCVGIALSYELNRRWTWQRRGGAPTASQMVSFAAMNLAGLGLSTVAVHTVAVIATEHDLTRLPRTAAVELVNIAAWGLLWVVQFVVLDRFVFRDRRPALESDQPLTPVPVDSEHVEVG
jgi:putative flippase GtrA